MKPQPSIVPGDVWGRLTFVGPIRTEKGFRIGLFRCACGVRGSFRLAAVFCGDNVSCGCYHREESWRPAIAAMTTHRQTSGRDKSPEYSAWSSMIARCTRPSQQSYPLYGGRGIRVCDRWRDSFLSFLVDVGPKPSPGHSIDRIDPDGHYEPGNVRWATAQEQGRNVRWLKDRGITIGGETKLLCEWAETSGIPKVTLWSRIKRGWSPERAVSVPVDPSKRNRKAGR